MLDQWVGYYAHRTNGRYQVTGEAPTDGYFKNRKPRFSINLAVRHKNGCLDRDVPVVIFEPQRYLVVP